MKLLIKPRLQKDKWSVYWKTSMATRTLTLDSFELDVDPAVVTGKQLRATVAAAIGLQPEKTLCRLEGFVEPWELAMHKGRELDDDKTLKDLGVEEEGSTIVTVRKVLVAEGWKIIQEDDEDSDTEEDDF